MKGNPEDAVIAEINALEADAVIDSQLAAGETRPRSVPACRCGAPWHGLPRSGCPGSHAVGERDLSEEPAGEICIDEQYELYASHGPMQIIPSAFAAAPPVEDPESAVRQFIDDVHRIAEAMANRADASDPMVIISGYDSPMDQFLAVDDGLASRAKGFRSTQRSRHRKLNNFAGRGSPGYGDCSIRVSARIRHAESR